MKRCRTCLYPDTKPDLFFDETGECSACTAYKKRPEIDWDKRKKVLLDLLEHHNGRCLVPSSGGKDSTAQVMMLRDLGAKVTVVTATTCMLTDIGRKNIENLGRYADTIEVTPNRAQRAKLNRLGLEMVGDISWIEHVSIFTIPFRMSYALGIPLIFFGENSQNQYGGPPGTQETLEMTRRWVSEFGGFLGLRPADMEPMAGDMSAYQPPLAAYLDRAGTEAHFLGQYLPWDSHVNAKVAIAAGMQWRLPSKANWWPWENQDNAQTGIHDHLMYRKFGYGRGCAQISVDIRTGRVTREEALEWVKRNDGQFPFEYMGIGLDRILDHIGMDQPHFWHTLKMFTNQELFEGEDNGRPILKE